MEEENTSETTVVDSKYEIKIVDTKCISELSDSSKSNSVSLASWGEEIIHGDISKIEFMIEQQIKAINKRKKNKKRRDRAKRNKNR